MRPNFRCRKMVCHTTLPFFEEVNKFVEDYPFSVGSRNQLMHYALAFYMAMFRRCGGSTDRNGFPVLDRLDVPLTGVTPGEQLEPSTLRNGLRLVK